MPREYTMCRPRIVRVCPECIKTFLTLPSYVDRGHGIYCCRACWRRSKQTKPGDFWTRVDQSGECWLWTGGLAKRTGYGKCWYQGKEWRAHRLAWFLTHGPIPDNLLVCHNCPGGDNPLCCRPDHLFLGTSLDNVRDMWQKGRAAYGEHSGMTKLTNEQVAVIRRLGAGGVPRRDIQAIFHISRATVRRIVLGESWKHLL